MITRSIPSLKNYQVVVLCDSWYTKKPLLQALTKFKNVDVIGVLLSYTVLFDLTPKPTGKRGRPRKKGDRLNYRNFKYQKEDNYFTATVKVITIGFLGGNLTYSLKLHCSYNKYTIT